MLATIEDNSARARVVREIMETGVLSVVLIVDGVATDYFSSLDEFADLSSSLLSGTVNSPYPAATLEQLYGKHELLVGVFATGGFIAYSVFRLDDASFTLNIKAGTRGASSYSKLLDRASLPHRFQATRFVGTVVTNYSNVIGINGLASVSDAAVFADNIKDTVGRVVIIGRKTFEAIGGASALPDRMIIVATTDSNYKPEGAFVTTGPEHFVDTMLTKFLEVPRVYIIGGALTFNTFMPLITDWRVIRHNVVTPDAKNTQKYLHMPALNPIDWSAVGSRNMVNKETGAICRIQNLRLRKLTVQDANQEQD